MSLPVYLDNNATTPCDPRVLNAMLPYFTEVYGNPANKGYKQGKQASIAVSIARERVAAMLGSHPSEIVFTATATEAINLAIRGVFEQYAFKGNHIITTATEHKAVLETCKFLQTKGASVTYLGVNAFGQIDFQELEQSITAHTILIAVSYANNETGVIAPIKEISACAKKHQVLFFTDATQAVGKIPVSVTDADVDLLAMSAHKFYGPKGIGALYVKNSLKLAPLILGGSQEQGLRSGTLNVPGIVGLGMACEIAVQCMDEERIRLTALSSKLETALLNLPGTFLNGDPIHRLPNTVNIAFQYQEHSSLLQQLTKELAVSTGSACSSDSQQPSHVLRVMGLGKLLAKSSIRFSLGRFTTNEDIEKAITYCKECIGALRAQSPLWKLHQSGLLPQDAHWQHPLME